MNKQDIIKALNKARESSKKRNFKQSVDLIVSFKNLDLKKPDNQLDFFVNMHYPRGKKIKVCGLVGGELAEQSKKVFDHTIQVDDFSKLNEKKLVRKLAKEYDFFVAQATIMPKIAQTFGRVLGPRQKMPNPKAGCVVPPNANLSVLYGRLQNVLRVNVKTQPMFQCRVGKEDLKEEELIDNIMNIYNSIVHHLPSEQQNIKKAYLKLTMGKAAEIGEKEEQKDKEKKEKTVETKEEKKKEVKPEEKPAEEKKEKTSKKE